MRSLVAVAAIAVLAACSQEKAATPESTEVALPPGMTPAAAPAAAPDALSGFSHPAGADLFGYYMPTADIQVGNFKLNHLHLGGQQEFADWEGGKREGVYAPVMLEFEDMSTPAVANELGGESRTTERALADAYSITATDVVFVDNHPKLGRINFTGKLDSPALAAAKAANQATERPVLTGTLVIGTQTFPNVQMTWFGGD